MIAEMVEQSYTSNTPEGTLFEMVPVSKMFLDSSYGRATSDSNLVRLRSKWNILKMGTLYASFRSDGRYAVIDGWHRRLVAEEKGFLNLPCYVYLDLTLAEEADLYDAFGTVFPQSGLVKFRARLVAGDAVAVAIDRIVHEAGLRINYFSHSSAGVNRRPTDINGVAGIEAIYQGYGSDHLLNVLQTVQRWFPGDGGALRESVIRAISQFLAQYDMNLNRHAAPPVDLSRMEVRCQVSGLTPVVRRANSIRMDERITLVAATGRALRATYNQGLPKNSVKLLSEWRDNIVTPAGRKSLNSPQRIQKIRDTRKSNQRSEKRPVFNDFEIAGRPD